MVKNHLKAIIWPRDDSEPQDGNPLYRYVVVGMLVSEQQIPSLEGNQFLIDGQVFGIEDMLDTAPKRKEDRPLGDASRVLMSLEDL